MRRKSKSKSKGQGKDDDAIATKPGLKAGNTANANANGNSDDNPTQPLQRNNDNDDDDSGDETAQASKTLLEAVAVDVARNGSGGVQQQRQQPSSQQVPPQAPSQIVVDRQGDANVGNNNGQDGGSLDTPLVLSATGTAVTKAVIPTNITTSGTQQQQPQSQHQIVQPKAVKAWSTGEDNTQRATVVESPSLPGPSTHRSSEVELEIASETTNEDKQARIRLLETTQLQGDNTPRKIKSKPKTKDRHEHGDSKHSRHDRDRDQERRDRRDRKSPRGGSSSKKDKPVVAVLGERSPEKGQSDHRRAETVQSPRQSPRTSSRQSPRLSPRPVMSPPNFVNDGDASSDDPGASTVLEVRMELEAARERRKDKARRLLQEEGHRIPRPRDDLPKPVFTTGPFANTALQSTGIPVIDTAPRPVRLHVSDMGKGRPMSPKLPIRTVSPRNGSAMNALMGIPTINGTGRTSPALSGRMSPNALSLRSRSPRFATSPKPDMHRSVSPRTMALAAMENVPGSQPSSVSIVPIRKPQGPPPIPVSRVPPEPTIAVPVSTMNMLLAQANRDNPTAGYPYGYSDNGNGVVSQQTLSNTSPRILSPRAISPRVGVTSPRALSPRTQRYPVPTMHSPSEQDVADPWDAPMPTRPSTVRYVLPMQQPAPGYYYPMGIQPPTYPQFQPPKQREWFY